jgi:hypothetical protein
LVPAARRHHPRARAARTRRTLPRAHRLRPSSGTPTGRAQTQTRTPLGASAAIRAASFHPPLLTTYSAHRRTGTSPRVPALVLRQYSLNGRVREIILLMRATTRRRFFSWSRNERHKRRAKLRRSISRSGLNSKSSTSETGGTALRSAGIVGIFSRRCGGHVTCSQTRITIPQVEAHVTFPHLSGLSDEMSRTDKASSPQCRIKSCDSTRFVNAGRSRRHDNSRSDARSGRPLSAKRYRESARELQRS